MFFEQSFIVFGTGFIVIAVIMLGIEHKNYIEKNKNIGISFFLSGVFFGTYVVGKILENKNQFPSESDFFEQQKMVVVIIFLIISIVSSYIFLRYYFKSKNKI